MRLLSLQRRAQLLHAARREKLDSTVHEHTLRAGGGQLISLSVVSRENSVFERKKKRRATRAIMRISPEYVSCARQDSSRERERPTRRTLRAAPPDERQRERERERELDIPLSRGARGHVRPRRPRLPSRGPFTESCGVFDERVPSARANSRAAAVVSSGCLGRPFFQKKQRDARVAR